MANCPRCGHRMSEWFTWNGLMHCLVCCRNWKWQKTVLEDGRIVDRWGDTVGQYSRRVNKSEVNEMDKEEFRITCFEFAGIMTGGIAAILFWLFIQLF